MRGFKSFATSTSMRFEPGVNAIVGPNGSGKSNVVDALAWVMGEQGAKNLRGGNMADVIFAGTAKRPALGRAEVSLTIDNSDGALPIDYTEVTITRRLFRNGGSEYEINGTSARLLDIQELLSDTGMGREMHVIIGQGRLDQVLTATPEDRRGIIEEAAGVLKHRRRKEKALRKLENMKASFTRVEDLAAELRRQLGPLAKQADAARRSQIIQATERDAKCRLLADDLAQQSARMESGLADGAKLEEMRAENRAQTARVRDELAAAEENAAALSPRARLLTDQWQQAGSLQERFRSLIQLAEERQRSLRAAGHTGQRGEDPAETRRRAKAARVEEEKLEAQASQARDALTEAIQAREEAEETERSADKEYATINRIVADRREDSARLAGKINAVRSRLEALEDERTRVIKEKESAATRAKDAALDVSGVEDDLAVSSSGDDSLAAAHEESARYLSEVRTAEGAARAALTASREKVASLKATVETLELSLAPEDATAWALERAAGLARDAVTVEAGWEGAAEAALGGAATGVVVETLADAVDLLREASESNAGLVDITIAAPTADAPGSANEAGSTASGWQRETAAARDAALDAAFAAVKPEAAVRAREAIRLEGLAADSLGQFLAGTALAADLVTARALLEAGAPRVVTAGGADLSAWHARGGEVSAASVLARQARYEEAREALEAAEEAADDAAVELQEAQVELESARAENEKTGAELNARDSQLAAQTAQLGALRQTLAATRAEESRAAERLATIEEDIRGRQEKLAELQARENAQETDPQDLAAKLEELAAAKADAAAAAKRARHQETETRLALRTKEERFRAIVGKADALERNAQAAEERIEREARAAERRREAEAIAQNVETLARRALGVTGELHRRVEEERAGAEAARSEADSHLARLRRQIDEFSARGRELDDTSHRRELVAAEQRLRYQQLAQKAADELGVEAETLIEEFGPHNLVPTADGEVAYVREEQEQRLAKAQRQLARLGKINPLALEEHAALEERQKYLSDQLADLKKTRADLLDIVQDIDARVEMIMTSALEDVAEKFTEVFATLFPGGEGRLVLTDPADVLTTGVEIEARPPGKRVKRLSLLSGGERSLTAIAFLVATFMARPSPFYVMDEVEAALDDVNLSRLLEIFRMLQKNSQLLIITHQKRTMEVADTLYGISMREDGVSTVVSQRMAEVLPRTTAEERSGTTAKRT